MFDNTPETEAFVESDDEVVTILRKAADVIRERGWCQQMSLNRERHVCQLGAVALVCGVPLILEGGIPSEGETPLYRLARCELLNLGGGAIFNDTPGRTASEVIDALEQAALHRARSLKTGV